MDDGGTANAAGIAAAACGGATPHVGQWQGGLLVGLPNAGRHLPEPALQQQPGAF